MAPTGILRIDRLFAGQPSEPISPGDPEQEAVAIIQEFLIGHGFAHLPGLLGPGRGHYGSKTTEAVRTFQRIYNLQETGSVDISTLQTLVATPATRPLASRGYLTLVLDFLFTGMVRLMSLTAQFEGAGLFVALNRNTDKAGLSFGLIQWAQKPGRLNELLQAFQAAKPDLFPQIFGGGNAGPDRSGFTAPQTARDLRLARGLIDHTAKVRGGTDSAGKTTDPRFDLIQEPWVSRFLDAGRNREFQRVQVDMALKAFRASRETLQSYAPQIVSERGVAFMLDLANQHGDGGAKAIFKTAAKPELSSPMNRDLSTGEAVLLEAIEKESVARVRRQFGNGPEVASTRNRRKCFRTSPLLSDDPFNPDESRVIGITRDLA